MTNKVELIKTKPSFSIYDASAGSGKTYTLVKEYLKIILTAKRNDAYRNILAITFTNKAVHEMKSRIVESLSEFMKPEPNLKASQLIATLSEETAISGEEIKIKARQIIKHIIHNYAAFDISTIDKFTYKIIKAFAYDLDLPITFEVTLDTDALLTEAVDAIIAKAGEDQLLTELLVDFTLEKTDEDRSWDISREIAEVGKLMTNENNREEISHFHSTTLEDFLKIKKSAREISKDLGKAISELGNRGLQLIENNGIEVASFYSSYVPKFLMKLKSGEILKNEGLYKYLEESEGKRYSSKTLQNQKECIDSIATTLLEIVTEVNHTVEKHSYYKAILKNITPLSLLNTLSGELTKIQEDQNTLSISEFNAFIFREIQNQPALFIYERLGERYRHFFIDEFQDTSEMQWQNLIPLIDNALSSQDDFGQKGTLMIVGDPKQSIYRWRGGKAEQFIALGKNQNPFNTIDKQVFHLDKNFRSYSEIINFNNDFFEFISSEFENEEYQDLYKNHSRQKTNDRFGGYVNLKFLPLSANLTGLEDDSQDKNEHYCFETLQTIKKVIQQGFRYSEIAILTRKRDQGVLLANYLSKHAIPLLSSETLMIQNASEVRFIIYFLKYLQNNLDLESKAHFLLYIAQNGQKELPIHDFIATGTALKSEPDFERWLQLFDISIIFNDVRKKPLYEAVETIIQKFIQPNTNNAYIHYFLDIVLERDFHKQSGISDFLTFWEKSAQKFSIPSPEGNDAVRMLTIHKSKGLEFPVVIIPFADEDYARKPKDKLWIDAEKEYGTTIGISKVLVDNNSTVEGFGENAATVYKKTRQEDLLDNINVLYVALTRAEEQLYLISQMIKPKKERKYSNTMAAFFITFLIEKNRFDENQFEFEFGNPSKLSQVTSAHKETPQIENRFTVLNPKNIKIAQKEALMWGSKQQEAIEYGNVIHEILSNIQTSKDIDLALQKALEKGLINRSQREIVAATLSQIVNHNDLMIYFAEGNRVLNEKSIIQMEHSTAKPDRIVITKENRVLLLDYKTGAHQEKYRLQLENYQTILESMNWKVAQKALVYIGSTIEIKHI